MIAGVALCVSATVAGQTVESPLPAPVWHDEPPQRARWLHDAWQAEQRHDRTQAAAWYCLAARQGSLEAQHRLGRLLLEHGQAQHRQEGTALLAQAAALGHHRAAQDLLALQGTQVLQAQPPACLTGGAAPVLERVTAAPDATPGPVPHEEVERYVVELPMHKRRHARLIQRLAPSYAVDPRLALAIARAESDFDPSAVSPRNARGLMQLVPGTAERFGVRDALHPEQNVRGGLSYLRWLLQRFDDDVALVSAAYNAGEGAVERYGHVPPYAETRIYVQRVLQFYRAPRHVAPATP